MVIELRKRQPITARPKTVIGVVNPVRRDYSALLQDWTHPVMVIRLVEFVNCFLKKKLEGSK